MASDLRIQGQLRAQIACGSTQSAGKSSKNKKVTDLAPSLPLTTSRAGTKEYTYTPSDKTSHPEAILQIFCDIFTSNSPFSGFIQEVIRAYLPQETFYIIPPPITSTEYLDLTDPKVLLTLLGKNCNSPKHITAALQIAVRTYECRSRPILSGKHGRAFPMNPEILAHAMRLAENEIVCEFAGASGENAILLAFAGAKKVYFNDIAPQEMLAFNSLKTTLPMDVRQKLEPIPGDCLDILKKKPALSGQIGLILCRNLIHFFDDAHQARFFQLMNTMLIPGGRVILTANAKYTAPEHQTTFEENYNSTCFKVTNCLVTNFQISLTMPSEIIYSGASVNSNIEPLDHRTVNLYRKDPSTGFKWAVDNKEFNTLDRNLKDKIKKAFDINKSKIVPIQTGTVRVLINNIRLYNASNLVNLVREYGFEVESIFHVAQNGHVILGEDLVGKVQQVGIICKKPA